MIASLLNLPIDYIFGAKFAIQFVIAVGLYTYSLSCKKYFWWRLLGCLCVAALTPFINEFTSVLLPKFSIVMAFFYIYSLFVIHFLFNISWMNALFCWISACATQFVVSQSYAFFDVLFGAFAADILEFIVFVVFYLFCYFFFARRIQNDGIGNINNARLTVLSAGIWLIADIVCNLGRSFLWETPLSAVYGVCCGLFILIIEFGLMRESKIEQDKKLIEQLLCQEEAQHRITQEAVEYIDIKSHDLKHEIECLRSMGRGENFEHIIGDIEKKVLEYEDIVKTENQTLNVVLTEKNLYCRRYGVKLYYMIDGKALDFMESQDLFCCSAISSITPSNVWWKKRRKTDRSI